MLLFGEVTAEIEKMNSAMQIEEAQEVKKAQIALTEIPTGLVNLGNTCYFNAVIQALKGLPPFVERLNNAELNDELALNSTVKKSAIPMELRKLFQNLDSTDDIALSPLNLLSAFRRRFTTFAEIGQQQDAEECFSSILLGISEGCSLKDNPADLFKGTFKTTLTSSVASEEPTVINEEFTKLSCTIDNSIRTLEDGLKLVEKLSSTLGTNTVYNKHTEISSLPKLLCIQFGRFFWRQDINKRTKISKVVSFPSIFDVEPFCDEKIRKQINDKRNEQIKEAETSGSLISKEKLAYRYTLASVICHIGISAQGGHYIAFSKKNGDWVKYDDKQITRNEKMEEILALDGQKGVNGPIAYLCIYQLEE